MRNVMSPRLKRVIWRAASPGVNERSAGVWLFVHSIDLAVDGLISRYKQAGFIISTVKIHRIY